MAKKKKKKNIVATIGLDGKVTKHNKKNNYGRTTGSGDNEKTIVATIGLDGTITKHNNDKKVEPITSSKKRSYFNKGLFKDGYDFGDVTRTLVATDADMSNDLRKGVMRIGEGLVDTVAYGAGSVAKAFGNEKFADKTDKFIARDLIEESEKRLDKKLGAMSNVLPMSSFGAGAVGISLLDALMNKGKTEEVSVLGDKSDSLVQSVGQIGGTVGLQAVGVPWYLTTGVTGFGSGAQEALQNDATHLEAGVYGGISAASEVMFEKLGGIKFGGKALDTGLKKVLSQKITNKALQTLTKFGLDAGAEGTEEVLTEITQNIGQKLTYEDEKTWKELLVSEEAMDGYLEAFIGGAVIGGGFNVGKTVSSIKTGRDYDTGLTANEQNVINREIGQRTAEKQKEAAVTQRVNAIIEEREKTFGTLKESEKKNIRDSVMKDLDEGKLDYSTTELSKEELREIEKQVDEDLKSGNIGVDSIESVISAEKTNRIKTLQQEMETADNVKKAVLEEEIKQLEVARAKELLGRIEKDSYLQESYRQEMLKGKEFTRETTEKDSDITKELIESAKTARMNDTKKMHDLFEYTNKIANDTKTKYAFVNNEQLKQLGHYEEGKTINGLVRASEDGSTKVLINVDSDKALNTIIGHETTHLLEGTNEYKALQNIVKEYATTKGEYDSRYKQISKLYQGTNANLENEITADLVGDYLFTDEQFINNLSTKEPNVFKRIYEYIKHAYKMATAGSAEARQLEQVKRKFDKAYKQISKTTTQVSKDNSLTEADSNTEYSLNSSFKSEVDSWYKDKAQFEKSGGFFKVGKTSDALKSIGVKDQNVVWDKSKIKDILNKHDEMTIDEIKEVPNIIENPIIVMQSKTRLNSITLFGEVYADGMPVMAAMQLSPTGKSGRVLDMSKISSAYGNSKAQGLIDTSDILYVDPNKKRTDSWLRALGLQLPSGLTTYGSVGKVTYYNDVVKSQKDTGNTALFEAFNKAEAKKREKESKDKLSLSDTQNLSKEQEEYFKDSKVRDENGNLKVMYHGTSAGGHTVFDPYGKAKYGLFGVGSYFTDNKSVAESYTEKGKGKNKQIYETYLNITNPIDMDAAADPTAWSKALPDANFPTEGTNEDFYRAMEEYFEDQEYSRWEASEAALEVMESMGYDGITHIGGGRFNKKDETRHRVYIAFQPEQIKSIDNTNPTKDLDINYSLSEAGTVVDGNNNEVKLQASAAGKHNDLMAVHNLTASKLKATLKLGAFPMPSIAVTNLPHDNFGDISILFGKETIDPKANKDNKVYSADAWTPTVPKVEYEANSDVLYNASNKLRNVESSLPSEYARKANMLIGSLDNYLQTYGTEEGIVERLKDEYSMKAMYLADKGETVAEVTKEVREDKTPIPMQDDMLALFEEDIETLSKTSLKELREKYVDDMKDVLLKYGRTEEQAEKILATKGGLVGGFDKYMSRLINYAKKPEFTVRTETDAEAMQKDIDSRVDDADYTAWLQNLVSGIEKDSGLYNGKDIFTPSGNRRSFKATHYPVTVENIVKAMKNEGEKNIAGFNGVKTIRAVTAKSFKSIDEIRKDKGKLQDLTQEEADRISDELQSKLYDIITNIKELNPKRTTGNTFIDSDNVGSMIQEMAAADMNADQMVNEFDSLGYNIDGSIPTDLEILFDAIKNMPVYIFEAKPRRVVGFDEIQAVIIPNDTDTGLKQELSDRGLYVVEYDPNIEGDRQNKINQFDDLKFSLSNQGENIAPTGDYNVYGRDVLLPVVKNKPAEKIAPVAKEPENILPTRETINMGNPLTGEDLPYVEQQGAEAFNNITDDMLPIVRDEPIYEDEPAADPVNPLEADGRDIEEVGKRSIKAYMYENPEVKPFFQEEAVHMLNDLKNSVKGQKHFNDQVYYDSSGEQGWYGTKRQTSEEIAYLLDNFKYTYADIEKGLNAIIEDHGAENNAISKRIEFMIDERLREGYEDMMYGDTIPPNEEYLNLLREKQITEYSDEAFNEWARSLMDVEPPAEPITEEPVNIPDVTGNILPVRGDIPITQGGIDYIQNLSREAGIDTVDIAGRYGVGTLKEMTRDQYMDAVKWLDQEVATPTRDDIPISQGVQQEVKEDGTTGDVQEDLPTKTRADLRKALIEDGTDFFQRTLDNAKNRAMALLNNTDTIRVQELVFGREAGKKINDVIFQKAIDNEARSIYWQNKQRADIKALGIKPKSRMSAAVQKYGEGEYINEFGDLTPYGEIDLMMEFPNEKSQEKIKEAARIIKLKYERYIDQANDVLTKLGFDPIPKRNDYMRHFQELNDAFSRFGIPFNAQSMQEHVLPTDINGLTEFWSPQKSFFANTQPRKGLRTEYDAITGIDGYVSGIANLIFHTEDIQRGRAFEEMIRERFGQENADEVLENTPEEERPALLEKIQDNHLSNYAAWVHEWTNNIAGKKNKVDRSVESMFGRRAFSFLDTTRKQVGANMIGFNVASSLTNLISPVQAISKTNKIAVAKGTLDTFKNIVKKDGFVDRNAFLTSRFGTDMLSKTPWQKMQDAGYVFMKGIDHFSSNMIVRSKYHELISKGMSEKEAHAEAGKFAARIMGDRTKGAQAALYNSKLIGMVTQFQLEVNNQLYAMFYDTAHESKEKAQGNALKMAAGMTFTLGQLFAFTHLFGKAFEGVAGYNPTFDVIGIIQTLFGIGGDDEEEKPFSERAEAATLQLLKSLPYTSTFTGGRIPIGQAFPIKQLVTGKDEYGNDKARPETLKETLPYYVLPAGYGQYKKTKAGLEMFDNDLPVAGSYTDSGNLRFPVEKTPANVAHAAVFGQWANENAQDYIDNERAPLKEKQIEEYKELKLPIADYWKIREGLKGKETTEEKVDYIADLKLPVAKKNILVNNAVNRKEEIDMEDYDKYGSFAEFDFAMKYPEKYAMSKAVGGYKKYKRYSDTLYNIKANKDENGESVRNSRKLKVVNYINGLEIPDVEKYILFKSEYNSDDTYNREIIDYLYGRDDITQEQRGYILKQLGFEVSGDTVYW